MLYNILNDIFVGTTTFVLLILPCTDNNNKFLYCNNQGCGSGSGSGCVFDGSELAFVSGSSKKNGYESSKGEKKNSDLP